jgi:hypothetical protein
LSFYFLDIDMHLLRRENVESSFYSPILTAPIR